MRFFVFFLLFLLVLPFAFSQKACGDFCTYDNSCNKTSDCPVCKDVNGYPAGKNGVSGTCQPYFKALSKSDVIFYSLMTGIILFLIFLLKKKFKRNSPG